MDYIIFKSETKTKIAVLKEKLKLLITQNEYVEFAICYKSHKHAGYEIKNHIKHIDDLIETIEKNIYIDENVVKIDICICAFKNLDKQRTPFIKTSNFDYSTTDGLEVCYNPIFSYTGYIRNNVKNSEYGEKTTGINYVLDMFKEEELLFETFVKMKGLYKKYPNSSNFLNFITNDHKENVLIYFGSLKENLARECNILSGVFKNIPDTGIFYTCSKFTDSQNTTNEFENTQITLYQGHFIDSESFD
jgi:hypothetical protein